MNIGTEWQGSPTANAAVATAAVVAGAEEVELDVGHGRVQHRAVPLQAPAGSNGAAQPAHLRAARFRKCFGSDVCACACVCVCVCVCCC